MREGREEVTVAGVCVCDVGAAALCNPCHLRHLDVFNPSKSIWSAQILYMEQNGPETEMAQPRPAASAADRRTALFETNCAPVRRTASLGRAS